MVQSQQEACFSFSPNVVSLDLGSGVGSTNGVRAPKLAAVGAAMRVGARGAPAHFGPLGGVPSSGLGLLGAQAPACAAVSFTTRGSRVAARSLVAGRGPVSRGRALPLCSLSLAAATVTSSPAPKTTPASTVAPKKKKSLGEVIEHAGKRALAGGVPGMIAMALQVLSLMWLRTTINYQYKNGLSTGMALKVLYKEGGIPRFYQGLVPALVQGPLSRFGDTAANTGTLALLEDVEMPAAAKTVAASLAAGLFRIFLMPVDALKTIMQVEGKNGVPALIAKVSKGGPSVLYHGALAASAATFVGHYPWFAVYNTLNELLPKYEVLHERLLRSAFIGFCSSFVSDCCSNSIRVIKTAKQTSTVAVTYSEVVKTIVAKEGVMGLLGRGLGTKLISNGIQGIMFSVLWRLGQDYLAKKEKDEAEKAAAAVAAAPAASAKK